MYQAAQLQLYTFGQAVLPLLEGNDQAINKVKEIVETNFVRHFLEYRIQMRSDKLGVSLWSDDDDTNLWDPLHRILQPFDYTMFFRTLTTHSKSTPEEIVSTLLKEVSEGLGKWLKEWLGML